MQVRIRQFSILMIASLIFFSSTGVAIYHHICGCPAPDAIVTQASQAGYSCCEAQQTTEDASGCSDGNHDRCNSENHQGCHDEVTYLKAPIISVVPAQKQNVSVVSFGIQDLRLPDAGIFSDAVDDASPYIDDYLIPPRAGGSLVILLHSIKIPSPEDLSLVTLIFRCDPFFAFVCT